MRNLLYKEWKLAFHTTVALFWMMSVMLLIPSYPYYVVFFYTMLGIFFVCLTGRENHDLEFTLSLPIRKRDLVKARFILVVVIEMVQLIIAVPCAIVRQGFPLPGNQIGMDANIAFFGIGLMIFALYNRLFLTSYYKNPDKVGKVFSITCVAMVFVIVLLEALTHILSFMRDQLDTPDPQFLTQKLLVLVVGVFIYGFVTLLSYRNAAATFEKLDL